MLKNSLSFIYASTSKAGETVLEPFVDAGVDVSTGDAMCQEPFSISAWKEQVSSNKSGRDVMQRTRRLISKGRATHGVISSMWLQKGTQKRYYQIENI